MNPAAGLRIHDFRAAPFSTDDKLPEHPAD
jgi:hypothetical protein